MNVTCPHCDVSLECDGSAAGQAVACPECNGKFTIPLPAAKVAKVAASAPADTPERELIKGHPSWGPFVPGLILGVLLIPLFGIGIVIIIIAIWLRHSMTYVLTTKNLVVTHGVLIKNESAVRVRDIRGISLKRDFFDAITGCGTLIAGTAATADAEIVIGHIKEAKKLQTMLNELRNQEN